MNYEIVSLQEKTMVGLTARTGNNDPKMGAIIGGLWGNLFGTGVYNQITNKKNECSIGLYSDYADKENADYSVTVGCEVSAVNDIPVGTVVKKIPAGKYAKFIVQGHMQKAVYDFWVEFGKMSMNRTYTGDFEEYQPGGTEENSLIHIYIAIKD